MGKNNFAERLMIIANQNIKEKRYWLERLSENINKSVIRSDYNHNRGIDMSNYQHHLPSNVEERLLQITKGSKDGLHMILITVLFIFLRMRCKRNEILIGTPVYKVDNGEALINRVLPIYGVVDDNCTFKELLTIIKRAILEADRNQNYPMDILAEQLNIENKNEFFPLFEIALLVEGIHDLSYFDGTNLNLIFSFDFSEQNATMKIIYNKCYYNIDTVKYIDALFVRLLDDVLFNPDKKIYELNILTKEEKHQLLFEFNNTKKEFPENKSIHELLEEQVKKQEDNIALSYDDNFITYNELNRQSNIIAQLLNSKGVKKNELIAIAFGRSIEMVISIFGVLKSGACYLPLDITYPKERLEYILKDSQSSLLLTNINEESLLLFEGEVININNIRNSSGSKADSVVLHDLAYVTYTSGSTGKPKGVVVEHRSVINLLYSFQKLYPVIQQESFLFKTSYCFDVSISELFGWILGGGKMVILPNEAEKDPKQIIDCICKEKVNFVNFVPSMFSFFVSILNDRNKRKLKSIKYIFLAGEELKSKLVDDFNKLKLEISLHNLYGPTEATVYVSNYSIEELHDRNKRIPIGKPLANVEFSILEEGMQIQPIGVEGELYISGECISKGYINQVELTHEKFIINPHKKGQLLYKTGDLARWLPNGNVEFLGRIDNQVKLRGFRIELGEIENVLSKHQDVRDSIVIKNEINREGYLCAYVIINDKKENIEQMLKDYLEELLPNYMIPSYFIVVDNFPTTTSGKLNLKKLPIPNLCDENNYLPPRNEVEKKIVQIWSEILNLSPERISITNNFFKIGGHSLRATIFLNRLSDELNLKLSLGDFFNISTIKDISELMLVTADSNVDGEYEEMSI